MGAIFRYTLRQNMQAIWQWGGGLGALGLMLMLIVTDMDVITGYADLLDAMPEEMLGFFGLSSTEMITSPDGFIAFGFFAYALMILGVYAVAVGLDVVANEEDAGVLDVLLSLPVSRTRMIVQRIAAYVVITALLVVFSFGGLLVGSVLSDMEYNMGRLFIGTLNIIPGTLVMIALTVFFSVLFRRRKTALSVSAAIIIFSYFINFLAESASNAVLDMVNRFSLFAYYDSQRVVREGLVWGDVAILLVVAALLFGASAWLFNRRDVGL
ncbi:MAG: hypothetical protein EA396_03355 [Anaerolineaceae bacterium]|nr:MAG: hypothetical protein EA396_03355 [Anaerolineaceae bacterium]